MPLVQHAVVTPLVVTFGEIVVVDIVHKLQPRESEQDHVFFTLKIDAM